MREWLSKLRVLSFGRRGINDDLREEIAAHIELAARDKMDRGLSQDAARSAARRHFGNATLAGERAQQAWTFSGCEVFLQQLRHALRNIRRSSGFSLVVILTLALGIGANTAIFSVVHSVLLKPLPYPAEERLVRLGESSEKAQGFSVTWINYQHWRQDNHSFEDLAAFQQMHMTLTGREEPLLTREAAVTSSFFDLVGMHPVLGRLLNPSDEGPQNPPVAVVSQSFWVDKLGGNSDALGAIVDLDGKPFQVVGVASSDLGFFLKPSDFYIPLAHLHEGETGRGSHGSIRVLGRLKPHTTPEAAKANLDAIMQRLAQTDPGPENDHRAYVIPLAEINRAGIRPTLLMLMGAVGLVLAIACSNVASLLSARTTARAREIAIRTAIGAGRMQLIGDMLTEGLLLSVLGGCAGLFVAYAGLKALMDIAPHDMPRLFEATLNYQVMIFVGTATLVTGLLVSLAPILMMRKLGLVSALKEGPQSLTSMKSSRSFRSALVVGEIALTLLLVFISGLLLRSLIAAQTSSPGFAPERLLALELILPSSFKSQDEVRRFHDRLREDLQALPGVESVASVNCPPSGGDCGDWFYSIPDKPAPAQGDVPVSLFNQADGGYFRSMGIPVLEGREFTEGDRQGAPRVAVVNRTFARKWWPDGSAVGHRIKVGGPYREGVTLEIVGVVGDVSQFGLDVEPTEEVFRPLSQEPSQAMVLMIRAAGDADTLIPLIRHTVFQANRNLPIQSLQPLAKSLSTTLDRRRFATLLLTLFAVLAMVLSSVGIYGLLAYWVSIQEKDIAIRMALGARRSIIVRSVGLQALWLAVAGIAIGALGAWVASSWVATLVFGISAHNPATMVGAALAVIILAGLAAALPAWRATKVDPLEKLHEG